MDSHFKTLVEFVEQSGYDACKLKRQAKSAATKRRNRTDKAAEIFSRANHMLDDLIWEQL